MVKMELLTLIKKKNHICNIYNDMFTDNWNSNTYFCFITFFKREGIKEVY
jgi:hypothetical protein